MKILLVSLTLSLLVVPCAGRPTNDTGHSRFSGVYRVYGGSLGDPVAPTHSDSKVMFAIRGSAAKDMFNAMAPDVRDECTAGSGIRMRKKDDENIVCMLTKAGTYSCNFGFDLKSGRSIGGILC